jgi:hypothetical protein
MRSLRVTSTFKLPKNSVGKTRSYELVTQSFTEDAQRKTWSKLVCAGWVNAPINQKMVDCQAPLHYLITDVNLLGLRTNGLSEEIKFIP